MKSPLYTLLLLPTLVLPPAFARAAGTAAPSELRALDVSVKVEGSSTLHAWEASALSVTVTAQAIPDQTGLKDAVSHQGLLGLTLVLDVASLKSTEGSGMDQNMHRAMESDKFPTIRFTMKSYQLSGLTVTALGDLEIHGIAKPVTLTGLVDDQDDYIVLNGSYPLLMSGYGVKPPVMMFGTIRVADQVKILYHFKLSQ